MEDKAKKPTTPEERAEYARELSRKYITGEKIEWKKKQPSARKS